MNHLKKQVALVCPLYWACCSAGFLSLESENKGKKRAKDRKKKLGDLILRTARQTSVTLAKEGQLLCIPDEVQTSASGENKRGVNVAPVYCRQMKPAAEGEARTSGFDEWWCCERSDTTFPHHQFASKPFVICVFFKDFN